MRSADRSDSEVMERTVEESYENFGVDHVIPRSKMGVIEKWH
jgi:hypothetical protein